MARRASSPGQETPAEPPFDERLERLEALVRELESGSLGLEASIERYEQGIALLKGCHRTLERFRARVEELSQVDGSSSPFAGDPDAGLFGAPAGSGADDGESEPDDLGL